MKSLTKLIRSEQISHDARVQLSLPVANVLRDVRSAFFGLCINAGKAVLGAMMGAERAAQAEELALPTFAWAGHSHR